MILFLVVVNISTKLLPLTSNDYNRWIQIWDVIHVELALVLSANLNSDNLTKENVVSFLVSLQDIGQ